MNQCSINQGLTKYLIWLALIVLPSWAVAKPLVVGITLHPYYSYTAQVVGDRATLLPLIASGFNPHNYELQPSDIQRLSSMDALVLNAIGHDEFAVHALEGLDLPNLTVINANKDVPLLSSGSGNANYNPHSFVSIDAAIRQVYTLAKELGRLDPNNASYFQQNALRYARELRQLKNTYRSKLLDVNLSGVRIASTHNAYGYLLQEFGIGVDTVIEPAHGVEPSASQLQATIQRINDANIQVLFTELDMDNRYVDVIEAATGIQIYHFSHMTHGDYDADQVTREMEHNLSTLVEALTLAAKANS
ncbi:metal ABC transporter solute-binding protein, Zn/Mn family [Marinospirillum minutulum]|uniref:metal ABC transporter solute-binding protein, Zn/Mn family n=1 Tax=Marinospirillum minutulum TaxID=64974 RepID=UPI0003F9A6BC|nr:zinc ABC transporter substrate-binding protein [Marinospirillum minutulum]